MMSMRLALVVAVVGLAVPCALAHPPGRDEPIEPAAAPEPPKADTAADLAAWAAEQKGAIEEIAGAKFATDVPVKVATTEELAERIAVSVQADMAGMTRPDGKPMTAVEIRIRAMAAAFKVATRTFGMYSHDDKVVYVAPENVAKYAKKYGWQATTVSRAPRLAIAHELVHALQDQKMGLSEKLAKLTGEERAAMTGVSEGHAVWVTDQLAAKLDWAGANAVLWGVVAGVRDEEDSQAKAAAAPKIGVVPAAELYSLGKKFMAHHATAAGDGDKGAERLWTILQSPPKTVKELKELEKSEVKKDGAKPDSGGTGQTRPTDKP